MITFKEAQEIIIGLSKSFGTEAVPLINATGRILAEPVLADRDYPPFNRATMDGYALNYNDVKKGILEFIVVETIFAGQVPKIEIESGQCYKIMTGAAVPAGADMIIQREHVEDNNGYITMPPGNYKPYHQISRRGEDVKEGACIVNPPATCTPAIISALAALGKTTVMVEKLPRVAVFTTGNEIVAVGQPVSSFQIRNSNQYMFLSLLQKWAIKPFLCEHIKDDRTDLYEMLSKGLTGDCIIISGGVSAGDADYVPEILETLGVKKLFHKIAIKPGKPFWCGHVPGGAMVFALPGNPTVLAYPALIL
jgi:molybdopterin molybdotransferase